MSVRVAVQGYGRFGRALTALLLESGADVRAFDPHGAVPSGLRATSPEALVDGADVVVVATPVPLMPAALAAVRPFLTPAQLVMDVGSVKLHPTAAMSTALGAEIPWVATHPLFGPTSLALGERPLRVVVCPNSYHPGATARARALFERIGCLVVEQDAETHDREMAETHALTFFVAKGLLDAGAGQNVTMTPPSFQAIARTIEVVRSDAGHLFTAIQRENPFSGDARRRLIEALSAVDRALVVGDPVTVDALDIPDLGTHSPELRETRELIDEVDRELVAALARRAQLARRAGQTKASLGRAVRDPAREQRLLESRRAWAAEHGLEPNGVAEIFEAILRFSRSVQSALADEGKSSADGEPDEPV
jgi:prephenate dehydrogenase